MEIGNDIQATETKTASLEHRKQSKGRGLLHAFNKEVYCFWYTMCSVKNIFYYYSSLGTVHNCGNENTDPFVITLLKSIVYSKYT